MTPEVASRAFNLNDTDVLYRAIQSVHAVPGEQYENSPTNVGDGAILEEHMKAPSGIIVYF